MIIIIIIIITTFIITAYLCEIEFPLNNVQSYIQYILCFSDTRITKKQKEYQQHL